jgi:hypothetical protein
MRWRKMPAMMSYGEGPARRIFGPGGRDLGVYRLALSDDPDPTDPNAIAIVGRREVPVVHIGGGKYQLRRPDDLRQMS